VRDTTTRITRPENFRRIRQIARDERAEQIARKRRR
jgi:hypothetical protein